MKVNNHITIALLFFLTFVLGFSLNRLSSPAVSNAAAGSLSAQWEIKNSGENFIKIDMVSADTGMALSWDNQIYVLDATANGGEGQWQLLLPAIENAELNDIDMVSATEAWAIGAITAGVTGARGAIWRYDGTGWNRVTDPPSIDTLYHISMLDSDNGWIVGEDEVLRYQNAQWEIVLEDDPNNPDDLIPYVTDLEAVADGVWGVDYEGNIYNYNNATMQWSVSITNTSIRALSMIGPGIGWGVGSGGEIRYLNRTSTPIQTWVPISSPTSVNLTDIVMVSANQGWATAVNGQILAYDGSTWEIATTGGTSNTQPLFSISMAAEQGTVTGGWSTGFNSTLLKYNATDQIWVNRSTPNFRTTDPGLVTPYDLFDVEGDWAVGGGFDLIFDTNLSLNEEAVILQKVNDEWQDAGISFVPDLNGILLDIDPVPNSSEMWAVGGGTTTLTNSTTSYGLILNYDGSTWTREASVPTNYRLYGVEFVDDNTGWAVGGGVAYQNGTVGIPGNVILSYDGNTWTTVTAPVTHTLYGISMVSANDGWAVGENNTILRYQAGSWTSYNLAGILNLSTDEKFDLIEVKMVSANDGWAVGQYVKQPQDANDSPIIESAILRYENGQWRDWNDRQGTPVDPVLGSVALEDIYIVSDTEIWAVGTGTPAGAILLFDGTTWDIVDVPTTHSLHAIEANSEEIWGVGPAGFIIKGLREFKAFIPVVKKDPTATPTFTPTPTDTPVPTSTPSPTPTNTPTTTPSPTPTSTPTSTPLPINYFEGFESGNRKALASQGDGWLSIRTTYPTVGGFCESRWRTSNLLSGNGVYEVYVDAPAENVSPCFRWADSSANERFATFEVDVTRAGGGNNFDYGIYVNGRGDSEYYLYLLSFEGGECQYWKLIRRQNSRSQTVKDGSCRFNFTGGNRMSENDRVTLKVEHEYQGDVSKVRVFIKPNTAPSSSYERLATYTERYPLPGTGTGVTATSYLPSTAPNIRIYFDNFRVSPPPR